MMETEMHLGTRKQKSLRGLSLGRALGLRVWSCTRIMLGFIKVRTAYC